MHMTPLPDIQRNTTLFLEQVPANKLVLGLAFYCRKYNKVNNFYIGGKGSREDRLYPVDSLLLKLEESCWEQKYDNLQRVPYMFNTKLHQLVSYDNHLSLMEKCKYVNQKKLRGVMYWAMDYDSRDSSKSYQKIVVENFRMSLGN
jgi:chitinase